MKLEIINISSDFVAGFWKFSKEKTCGGTGAEEMFKFSTTRKAVGSLRVRLRLWRFHGLESSCARRRPRATVPTCSFIFLDFHMLPQFFSAQVHDHEFGLGHLFDGIAQPFAAKAGIFDAAVGHVIDAERRNISSNHASDFEFFVGMEN